MPLYADAYTGKIWTNAGDAASVDAGITYDAYGNWALLSPYPTNSPVVTFTELDLGYNATFYMSSFKANEVLTTGSVKYQYRTHATDCASGSYNGTWLTRRTIHAVSDISYVE